MKTLIEKFYKKIINSGLAEKDQFVIAYRDAQIKSNLETEIPELLQAIFQYSDINYLIYAQVKEPYLSMIEAVTESNENGILKPEDAESRIFLPEIPFYKGEDQEIILNNLKIYKCIILKDSKIVTLSHFGLDQAFVILSSICFILFVKYYVDLFNNKKNKDVNQTVLKDSSIKVKFPELLSGKFSSEKEILSSMIEIGKYIVDYKMVDSSFGNVSFANKKNIFISRTGSYLDDLYGEIEICPKNGSTTNALTASYEYFTHKEIYKNNNSNLILHGHPKFTVILSMLCDKKECINRGFCHEKCREERFVDNIPIAGGIRNNPQAISKYIKKTGAVIVFGHGVFIMGKKDYNEVFRILIETEKKCKALYFKKISD